MALIISLNNEVLASQEEPDADEVRNQQSAEVIIFPGVRYERWDDARLDDMQSETNGQTQSQHDKPELGGNRDWLKV